MSDEKLNVNQTKAELIELAAAEGIEIDASAKKGEIFEVIEKALHTEPEDAPAPPTAESGVFEPEHNEDELITHDFLGTPIADIDYPPSKPEYAQAYQHPVV